MENQQAIIDILQSLANSIMFYFSVTTMPLGIIFNLVAYFIFGKSRLNNKTNLGFLYRLLCFVTIVALVHEIVFNVLDFLNIDVFTYSQFNCKFLTLWTIAITHVPSFVQVLTAIDLHILVAHPNKAKYFTQKSYSIVILVACVLILALNSFNLTFEITVDEVNSTMQLNETVNSSCETSDIMDLVADVVNIMLRAVMPFVALFVLNWSTTQTLVRSRKRISLGGHSDSSHRRDRKESSFAMATIWMNALFLVMYIPWMVSFFVYDGFFFTNGWQIDWQVAVCNIFSVISDCIANFNYYSLFFTNMIFNKHFKIEFFRIFKLQHLAGSSDAALDESRSNPITLKPKSTDVQ